MVYVRDDGDVTNLIHSVTMSVGQPASVDGHSRVIAVSARPTIQRAEYAAALPGVKRVPKELEARRYANGGRKSKSAPT